MKEVALVEAEKGSGFGIVKGGSWAGKSVWSEPEKRRTESERRGRLKRVVIACARRVEMRGQVMSVEAVWGGRKSSRNRGGSDRHRGSLFRAVQRRVIRSAGASVFKGAEGREDRG